jgi:hypothetical protein
MNLTNTYKLGDTVLLTDSDEIGEVATIINIASDSYELEFQDGECGWYALQEFELAGGGGGSMKTEQIDAILTEDLDALLVHFGRWENHGTYYTDSNGAVCYSTETASQEEIREALHTARQTCADYANDENGGILTENLVRSVRGSL